jgi:hypothetical protein
VFALVVRATVSATKLVRGLRVGEVSVCMPRFKSRNDSSETTKRQHQKNGLGHLQGRKFK